MTVNMKLNEAGNAGEAEAKQSATHHDAQLPYVAHSDTKDGLARLQAMKDELRAKQMELARKIREIDILRKETDDLENEFYLQEILCDQGRVSQMEPSEFVKNYDTIAPAESSAVNGTLRFDGSLALEETGTSIHDNNFRSCPDVSEGRIADEETINSKKRTIQGPEHPQRKSPKVGSKHQPKLDAYARKSGDVVVCLGTESKIYEEFPTLDGKKDKKRQQDAKRMICKIAKEAIKVADDECRDNPDPDEWSARANEFFVTRCKGNKIVFVIKMNGGCCFVQKVAIAARKMDAVYKPNCSSKEDSGSSASSSQWLDDVRGSVLESVAVLDDTSADGKQIKLYRIIPKDFFGIQMNPDNVEGGRGNGRGNKKYLDLFRGDNKAKEYAGSEEEGKRNLCKRIVKDENKNGHFVLRKCKVECQGRAFVLCQKLSYNGTLIKVDQKFRETLNDLVRKELEDLHKSGRLKVVKKDNKIIEVLYGGNEEEFKNAIFSENFEYYESFERFKIGLGKTKLIFGEETTPSMTIPPAAAVGTTPPTPSTSGENTRPRGRRSDSMQVDASVYSNYSSSSYNLHPTPSPPPAPPPESSPLPQPNAAPPHPNGGALFLRDSPQAASCGGMGGVKGMGNLQFAAAPPQGLGQTDDSQMISSYYRGNYGGRFNAGSPHSENFCPRGPRSDCLQDDASVYRNCRNYSSGANNLRAISSRALPPSQPPLPPPGSCPPPPPNAPPPPSNGGASSLRDSPEAGSHGTKAVGGMPNQQPHRPRRLSSGLKDLPCPSPNSLGDSSFDGFSFDGFSFDD